MSSNEIWTYVAYALSGILFLIAVGFIAMLVISSQNIKQNPIALPKAQKQEDTKKEMFDGILDEEEVPEAGKKSLPGRRAKVSPIVHQPKGNLSSSSIFDEDDNNTFTITSGKD